MAITLGGLTLPQGLHWSDEFAWNAFSMLTEYSLTGSLVVDIAAKQAGRPITLTGDENFTWITRADINALQAILNTCTVTGTTLTLHDDRSFTVVPYISSSSGITGGALVVSPIPLVLGSGPANPNDSTWYALKSLSLVTI